MSPSPLQWIEIRSQALRHNLQAFRSVLPEHCQILPVIKGNAYGHDIVLVAKALQKERLWGFGVANLDEAYKLRQAGLGHRLLVLTYYRPSELRRSSWLRNISFVVFSREQARSLNSVAKRLRRRVPIHIKVDTGTSRIGFFPAQFQKFLRELPRLRWLTWEGVFTHFADTEGQTKAFTYQQLQKFSELLNRVPLPQQVFRHCSCTAAIIRFPQSHGDVARLGLGLYGLWPSTVTSREAHRLHPQLTIQPVLQWKTRLLQVKTVPAGTYVGYGRSYRAVQTLRYGVLPVGYWDGYDRGLSNRGYVLVHGQRCSVIGRISMHLTMINLRSSAKARPGDEVVLIGQQGREVLQAETVAQFAKTIQYELLTRINPLIPRFLR